MTLKNIYEKKYKLLLVIPILMLLAAIAQIGMQYISTGDFLNKDVSLKGGMTITVPLATGSQEVSVLEDFLRDKYPENDISVRELSSGTDVKGVIVAADILIEEKEKSEDFIKDIAKKTDVDRDDFSIEYMGSSLGASFFRETFTAVLIAFLFMGMIVFLYFGEKWTHKSIVVALTLTSALIFFNASNIVTNIIAFAGIAALIFMFLRYSIPSFAVILAALSDIIITLAIVNVIGIKLSAGGIAAFLMLIGYSVDTDILLSTKLLKRKEGTLMERVYSAMKTGLTMNITTIAALTVALMLSQSTIISQIMTILLIGLFIDIINTWIQNVGILRMYLERKR